MAKRIITLILLLPFLYVGAVYCANNFGGEVVQLETIDVFGRTFPTKTWIVDAYGDTWIRANDPETVWLQRIGQNPIVYVTRKGVKREYEAEVATGFTRQINEAMREKYGRADEIVAPLRDDATVVAIRLRPTRSD